VSAVYRIAGLGLVALLLLFVGVVLGQQSAPTDYKRVTENILAAIDLSKEVESVQGRELRLSSAVIEPGGHVGLHSHRGDPSIVYILSGVLTNYHDDGTTQEFHAGQVFSEYGPRSHWVENKGSAPVRFIVVNVHHE
jgi:quercetin dioxygenase-like cupin family protein